MNIDDETVKSAVQAVVAQQILDGLATEHRDVLLRQSIEKVLRNWTTTGTIEKVVATRAGEIAQELCRTEGWTRRIEDEIRAGFEVYLNSLRLAAEKGIVHLFHGSRGRYSECAPILGQWPRREATEE